MTTQQVYRRPLASRVLTRVRTLPGFRRYPMTYVSSAVRARGLREDLATIRTVLMFVGHERSGHSLVGALLDAHPNMAVAHELDALRYVEAGYRREQLFTLMLEHSKANARNGRVSWGYSYTVPGQWQGRYRRLEVVGDKRGRKSTTRLRRRPELFEMFERAVALPVSVVQVVRNPYDNIATMFTRGRAPMEHQVDVYFSLSRTVDHLVDRLPPERFHRVHHEDLIAEAGPVLGRLCDFLDVPSEPDYLAACSGIVFANPHRTRDSAPWTPELLAEVERGMGEHDWLARYSFGN